jgi:hypothetical protein
MRLSKTAAWLGLLAAIGLSTSSAAAGNVPRMGDQRVGIFACAFAPPCGDVWLSADEPFHVAHGFTGEPKEDLLNPLHRFELSIDGVQEHGAIDLELSGGGEKWYVFNVLRGMTGTQRLHGLLVCDRRRPCRVRNPRGALRLTRRSGAGVQRVRRRRRRDLRRRRRA